MTQQQSTGDILAALEHYMRQLERAAHNAQQMAEQWEGRWRIVTVERDALSRQLAELSQLVGAETPIAAFTLAQAWYAEKAALTAERDAARTLAASETHAWELMKAAWERSEARASELEYALYRVLPVTSVEIEDGEPTVGYTIPDEAVIAAARATLKAKEHADGNTH